MIQVPKGSDENFDIILDESVVDICYIGRATRGAVTSNPVWQIRKIVLSSGITTEKFADNSDKFTKIWDSRTTYGYT